MLPALASPSNDPTLLLTTAGMVQFKPFFLRQVEPEYPCAASVQKCLRTTDVDEVGKTARHLTFFEMLGNFSFGEYYKDKAIPFAWEFLTSSDWVGLDGDRFIVTVYNDDDEAAKIWEDIGVSKDNIVRMGEESNFWSAGPTGPCGPCSELLYDLGDQGIGDHNCHYECECGRYLEVWNLVFMQYDRDDAGEKHPLEHRGIDTGMGLERLVSILQGKKTNFETDLLFQLLSRVSEISGTDYGVDHTDDISLRIVADHARAVSFLVSDGVLPSNEGRGYVLRRLLRRAVRHGRRLGVDRPFMVELSELVIDLMGDAYEDLRTNREHIVSVVGTEEDRFIDTLRQGTNILNEALDRAGSTGDGVIPGDTAFQLHDTFGFPLELTVEMAQEKGLIVDTEGFDILMKEQKIRSTGDGFQNQGKDIEKLYISFRDAQGGPAEFLGYESQEGQTELAGMVIAEKAASEAAEGDQVDLVFSPTPFYAESGGQIGDNGIVESETGRVVIDETLSPIEGVVVHRGTVATGTIQTGQTVTATVDSSNRQATMRNHSATHILHWALRAVLGDHVKQAGSLVTPDRLRFDFSQPTALTAKDLKRIERLANERILANQPVRTFTTTIDYAKEIGAMALFGEKYGKYVRVVETGDYSKELCGGTHVHSTGDIGSLRITSEGSVGANLRRIEAVSGLGAYEYSITREETLADVASVLNVPSDEVPGRVKAILGNIKDLEKELAKVRSAERSSGAAGLIEKVEKIGEVDAVVAKVEASDFDDLRAYIDVLRNKQKSGVFVLAADADGKALLVTAVTKDLSSKGLHAGNLVKEIAPEVGGGGGGRPELAQAAGKNASGIEAALQKARDLIGSARGTD